MSSGLSVCIATYRRPKQLINLLTDLTAQHFRPRRLIVVDGDPSSGAVAGALSTFPGDPQTEFLYLPSSHASLPYQRFLGWRAAWDSEWLLYLDDDLRIADHAFTQKLIRPLKDGCAGVTCPIEFGDPATAGLTFQTDIARLTARGPGWWHKFFHLGRTAKGGLSPAGHRRMPVDSGSEYETLEWLSGGVMAFRADAISGDCFPETGFALFRARRGTGEDLVLARHVRNAGPLAMAWCTRVRHPYEVPTNFGPQSYFPLGLTMAYGERYVNDHFRGNFPVPFRERLFLVRSLTGNLLLSWARIISHRRLSNLMYSAGYMVGMLRALVYFPRSRAFAPGIVWAKDAERDLASARQMQATDVIRRAL